MREEKMLNRLRNKDPDGLRGLMDRYMAYVSAVVWGILRIAMTPQDAEEVVSDVFLAAWNQAEDLENGKVKAWLGAVARNKAKNKLREINQTLPLEEDILELPDREMNRLEERQLVRQAVDSLDPTDREIFLRHYYYGQQISEISNIMDIKEATVKTKLHRGRLKLKEYLTGRDIV
ncbi:MAG: RNA polymerase sigma factor [Oscillospiraceae bacterium]|nr:RNA polymerase sigma factor [Oscillospiraceae bacterium]